MALDSGLALVKLSVLELGPDSVPRRHSLTRAEPRAAATRATFATTDVDICE